MPKAQHILGIDQGTSNTKVVLVSASGAVLAQAARPVAIEFPRPAWVQQDPQAVWESVKAAIDDCLRLANYPDVTALAISNQRESAVAWERATGQPIGPLISWQCRRSADFCAHLRDNHGAELIQQKTGLTIDPLFTASKIRWLLDHTPDGQARAANGEICVGTVDSWLLWNLSGAKVHRTDISNASRTQLLNLESQSWDKQLLEEVFNIPEAALAEVLHSAAYFAETVQVGELPAGIPIASMIGDSHAALFGHAGFDAGSVKATYGTGSSLMTPMANTRLSHRGLATTIAWGYQKVIYALEGNISVTGAAVAWLADFLGLDSAKVASLALEVDTTDGITFVPAFVGLGAPHWDDNARGLISGLTRGAKIPHVARAVIESIAFQIRDVFEAMQADTAGTLDVLLADGGVTANEQLMQFQADILGVPVQRNATPELSALGAAYLAGLTTGIWASADEVRHLERSVDLFEPRMNENERETRYHVWQEAVQRAMLHVPRV